MEIVNINYLKSTGDYTEIIPSTILRNSSYTGTGTVLSSNLSTGLSNGTKANPTLMLISCSIQNWYPGTIILPMNTQQTSYLIRATVDNIKNTFIYVSFVYTFNYYYVSIKGSFNEEDGGSIENSAVQNASWLTFNANNIRYPVLTIA